MGMPKVTTSGETLDRPLSIRASSSMSNRSSTALPSCTTADDSLPEINRATDPYFNPPFANDVRMETRSWRQNIMHFAKKHKDDGLVRATFRHWKAHFEFGSCLLDSRRLRLRYGSLIGLNTVEPVAASSSPPAATSRVRFIQFYTACYKSRVERDFVKRSQQLNCDSPGSSPLGREHEKANREAKADILMPRLAEEDQLFFCRLARDKDGQVDPLWKKVMITTNDEIAAHTSLFKLGQHYEGLVDAVCTEIVQWVTDNTS